MEPVGLGGFGLASNYSKTVDLECVCTLVGIALGKHHLLEMARFVALTEVLGFNGLL
jgi:hypothetical protein